MIKTGLLRCLAIAAASSLIMACAGCASTPDALSSDLDKLIERLEEKESLSDSEFERYSDKLSDLKERYNECKEEATIEQNFHTMAKLTKATAILLQKAGKGAFEEGIENLDEKMEQLGEDAEDLGDDIKDSIESVGDAF